MPLIETPTYCQNSTNITNLSFNKVISQLKHEYQLMDESGPAHKKLFTVQLVLTPTQVR